jgi:4-amino-4-deoxy-L-arabinose transferase-like glycosyltransferase
MFSRTLSKENRKRPLSAHHTDKKMFPQKILKNEAVLFLILIALCLTLFFFRLGSRPLWDIDEGMHAVTSKEMILSGDWITPSFNGEPFYDKPVFHNWLVALAFLVLGFTEFAARLPAAVLGSGCVMVTYLLGKKMYHAGVGFLAAVILATSVEFIILSRTVVHDISLVFFVTLALTLFYMGYKEDRHRRRNLLLFYGALGFAVLSKGPVGLALPAMIIGLYLIVEKNLKFIMKMHIGWGILIFLAVASPWYVSISLKNSDYAGYFLIEQNLGSFLSSDPRHPNPFYYYIPVLFGGFFPWSCFLPLALIFAFRKKFKSIHESTAFLVSWFGIVFVFFSIATSKLGTYILPLFPAASLLVAICWQELLNSTTVKIRMGFLFSFLPVVLIFLAAIIYLWLHPLVEMEYEAGITMGQIYFLAVWLVSCIVLAFLLLLRKKNHAFFTSIVGITVSAILLFLLMIVPSVNPYRSTKQLSKKYDQLVPANEKLVFYRGIRESALFYTNRRAQSLKTAEQLKDYLASDQRVYAITTRKRLARLPFRPYVVARQGDKFLISNKKSP